MSPGVTNPPVELARYRITAGERVVQGQRVDGVVLITDRPADGHGHRFLIERGLTSARELEALIDDYLQQAAEWDAVPAVPCCLETEAIA